MNTAGTGGPTINYGEEYEMKDYLVRALRTFVQAFLGTLLSFGLINTVAETGVLPGFSALTQVALAAFASGIIAVITFTQNYLEQTHDVYLMPK